MSPKKMGVGYWLALAWLIVVLFITFCAPLLPLKNPETNFAGPGLAGPRAAPSLEHWFGTDDDARDVFSRTVAGARVSVTVGIVAITMGVLIGGTLGIAAGFRGGWLDRIVSITFLVMLSFPSLVFAVLLTSLINRSLLTVAITLGVVGIAPIGRLARATTVQFADREFVTAAKTLGATKKRIVWRELLPNVAIPMGALALLGVAISIVAEGGLAFLGLSVQEGISWGKLINNGATRTTLERAPWVAMAPILILFLTVLALNYAGDRLRDHFDARELVL